MFFFWKIMFSTISWEKDIPSSKLTNFLKKALLKSMMFPFAQVGHVIIPCKVLLLPFFCGCFFGGVSFHQVNAWPKKNKKSLRMPWSILKECLGHSGFHEAQQNRLGFPFIQIRIDYLPTWFFRGFCGAPK